MIAITVLAGVHAAHPSCGILGEGGLGFPPQQGVQTIGQPILAPLACVCAKPKYNHHCSEYDI